MLWVLPLEPLVERYTEQWYRWFAGALDKRGLEYRYIDGQMLTDSVETGTVLDAEGTNFWKFRQLQEVCRLFKAGAIRDGDAVFTMDLWHPGLEAVPYMACLEGLRVQVYGFLHAGSYTTEDFAVPMAAWAQHFERGWAAICDGIFVGSQYHKEKFLERRFARPHSEGRMQDKIHVTGNPFDSGEVRRLAGAIRPAQERERTIIFPHRWDIEKRPNKLLRILENVWELRQDFRLVVTTSRPKFRSNRPWLVRALQESSFPVVVKAGLSKAEYYHELAAARIFVSTAIEENFGYCLVEALALGCVPVVPRAFSYPELLDSDPRFLYSSEEQAADLIMRWLDEPTDVPCHLASRHDKAIDRILDVIQSGTEGA